MKDMFFIPPNGIASLRKTIIDNYEIKQQYLNPLFYYVKIIKGVNKSEQTDCTGHWRNWWHWNGYMSGNE